MPYTVTPPRHLWPASTHVNLSVSLTHWCMYMNLSPYLNAEIWQYKMQSDALPTRECSNVLPYSMNLVGVSQTAALNGGRHLYSAGRLSRWALAHISSSVYSGLTENAGRQNDGPNCKTWTCRTCDQFPSNALSKYLWAIKYYYNATYLFTLKAHHNPIIFSLSS